MVVVGHYWRSRGGDMHHGKGEDLFSGTKATSPLGRNQRVMCIDYSIGRRNEELGKTPSEFRTALAAYRWPEAKVKFAPA